ncbi:hypothetical protein [Dyadobacter chenhuakuii]|uniref:Uncharacterized protein n=1 Tax=Dyadobacter chenhuakuii TaxID=2909339 RepID=A0A9X1TS95_9BACT|nr:hypothetical protein [Dyadobacter chenhuakuii]MCF2496702.1 hypothetical protein [Dyadobacter chenhuakuii]
MVILNDNNIAILVHFWQSINLEAITIISNDMFWVRLGFIAVLVDEVLLAVNAA